MKKEREWGDSREPSETSSLSWTAAQKLIQTILIGFGPAAKIWTRRRQWWEVTHMKLPLRQPGIDPDGMYNVMEHYNHNMKAWAMIWWCMRGYHLASQILRYGSSDEPAMFPVMKSAKAGWFRDFLDICGSRLKHRGVHGHVLDGKRVHCYVACREGDML
jgi:hypothetical protein